MIIPQLYISMYVYCNNEKEIVDVNVRLNQAVRCMIFQNNIIRHGFEFPEAWVQLLQDQTIICWFDIAENWYQ